MLDRPNKIPVDWVPAILSFFNFFANLANDIYLPSMPKMAEVFATDPKTVQLTMTAWFIGIATPQLMVGPLSERIGRRPIICMSSICLLCSTLLCIYSTNIITLIIGRLFQGVGVCGLNVATFSILVDLYDYQKRIYISNYLSGLASLAPLIGPIIGGYIFFWYGWKANFIFIFALISICTILAWLKIPESNKTLNPAALHVKTLYKNYLKLILSKQYFKNLAPYCLLLSGSIVYLTAAPFIIIQNIKIPPQHFGYTQIPIVLGYIIGTSFVHFGLKYLNVKNLITIGILTVTCAASWMLINSIYLSENLYAFIVPMIFYTFGFGVCTSPFVTSIISHDTSIHSYSASFLGFSMAGSCALSNTLLTLTYNGTSLSIAILLLAISLVSLIINFLIN